MNSMKKTRARKQSSASPTSIPNARESLRRQLNTEYIVNLIRSDIRRKYLNGLGHQGAPIKYSPRVDIIDDPTLERIIALYELPGMKSSELNIAIRDNFLHVQGTRTPPTLEYLKQIAGSAAEPTCSDSENMLLESNSPRPPKYLISDLRYGFFHRQIPLPAGTEESHIIANFESGILRVTWPRGSSESPVNTAIPVSSVPSTPTPI